MLSLAEGKGLCAAEGLRNQCSSGSFYLCPHLCEVNPALNLTLLRANPAAGKCVCWEVAGFMSLGITLSFSVTSRVGNLGIFSVLVNISEKNPMNPGSLEPVEKECPAVFVTR